MATGTSPRPVSVPGARCYDDLADVLRARHPRVAVVGGGEAAFDYALSLARAGVRVTILARSAPNVRGRLPALVAASGAIAVRTHVSLIRASRTETPAGLRLELQSAGGATEALEVDALLGAIGRQPTVRTLLAAAALDGWQEALEPRPGLFVCGDARHGALGQVGMAVGDGLAAAMRVVRRHEALRAPSHGREE
jgi:thioredoxin reductase